MANRTKIERIIKGGDAVQSFLVIAICQKRSMRIWRKRLPFTFGSLALKRCAIIMNLGRTRSATSPMNVVKDVSTTGQISIGFLRS